MVVCMEPLGFARMLLPRLAQVILCVRQILFWDFGEFV